jgi:hypothetical protein
VPFGRNRESRNREDAGRRNWPEAVPKKMRGRKRSLTEISCNRDEWQTRVGNQCGKTVVPACLFQMRLVFTARRRSYL